MKDAAKQIVEGIVAKESAVKIGSSCVIGYLAAGTPAYERLTGGRAPKSGRAPNGIIAIESMRRHDDALSVTGGIWQHSTDTEAPTHKWVWVLALEDTSPDIDHLCREDGTLHQLMRGMM